MIRSRLRKVTIVAGAGAVATVSALALNPFSASADPGPTSTTVTAPSTVVTGHAVTFTATVSPSRTLTHPVIKATNPVTFTITGSDSISVPCIGGDAVVLNGQGKALCKVAPGGLLASASPYAVTASYAGDANFGPSTSALLSETVSAAKTHLKLTYLAKPTSGSASTFTATVTGRSGPLPTGNVQFSVSSTPAPGQTSLLKCAGGNGQHLSANAAVPPVATATCALSAKWFKVPAATKTTPKPVATWTVTATYDPPAHGNFLTSNATRSGSAKS